MGCVELVIRQKDCEGAGIMDAGSGMALAKSFSPVELVTGAASYLNRAKH
jgi:hypothetical protein